MSNVKLSIILPVYNGEKFLMRAVDSVLKSSFSSWELLLVNDGSTDFTESLCMKYCAQDKRIKYISQDNRGLSAARNAGFFSATGKYIVFLDADDYVEENYYTDLVKAAEDSDVDFIVTGFTREFQHKNWTHCVCTHWTTKSLQSIQEFQRACCTLDFYNVYIHVWNKIYRREYLIEKGIYFDERLRYGEDVPYNLQVLSGVKKILLLNSTGYHYVCRSSGQLTRDWQDHLPDNNAEIFLQIANHEYTYWGIIDPFVVAGMYLRSCCLTLEKLSKTSFQWEDKERIINALLSRKETILGNTICKEHPEMIEFYLYSRLFSIKNPRIVYFFVLVRYLLKMAMIR